jgi:hypothetical protein
MDNFAFKPVGYIATVSMFQTVASDGRVIVNNESEGMTKDAKK